MATQYIFPLKSIWTTHQKESEVEQEKIIRNFLLSHSDMLRLDNEPWTVFPVLNWKKFSLIRRLGNQEDQEFLKTLSNLKEVFIEKWADTEKYHVEQPTNHLTEHYLFNLTVKLKKLLNESTLFWMTYQEPFYGFENPSFYRKQELLGHVISHERIILLNLFSEEVIELKNQGIDFNIAESCEI